MTSAHQSKPDRHDRLRILSEDVAITMLACASTDEVLWHLARNVVAKMGFDDVVIYMLDTERQSLTQRAAFGNKNPSEYEILDPIVIPLGQGIVGRVALTGESELITDTSTHPEYIVDDEVRLSELAVPMSVGGEVIGVIDSEHPDRGFYTEQDQQILSAIASIGATKISQTLAVEALRVERSQLSDGIEERTADLVAANRQLAQANKLKDEFLASMSHELRTPLNTVLGMSEALTEGVFGLLTPEQAESVGLIHESGTHLLSLINDILDLHKIERGQVKLDLHLCSIHETCASAVRMIRKKAEDKGLKFDFRDDSAAAIAVLDSRRVKQALINLLNNAVKFTPEGGSIGLCISLTRENNNELINFEVWDSGIGIPKTEIKNLFVPFQQIDSGLSRAHEGTGLGLVITERLVELHGGTIRLESDEGQGTRVTLKFPLINHA